MKFRVDTTMVMPTPVGPWYTDSASVQNANEVERALPSMGRRIMNVTKAVGNAGVAVVDTLTGRTDASLFRTADQQAQCDEICAECEWFRESDGKCAHPECGCPTGRKKKLRIWKCPLGKWPE